ncbi:hypothetical protein H8356DRAFT_1333977 [Neocallimastix lanati (nom. inval.)]|nr:hypothetical protein H8356DRAFT_1333977 [Neocallimastix sp. JGI-2020a]
MKKRNTENTKTSFPFIDDVIQFLDNINMKKTSIRNHILILIRLHFFLSTAIPLYNNTIVVNYRNLKISRKNL